MLFEYLIPKVADLLSLPSDASYEDIAIGLLENIAAECSLERFRIYDIRELHNEIVKKYTYREDDFIREVPGFLRSSDFIARIVKDRIIGVIANVLFGSLVAHV